jgi:C-terminal processing protease CtpA/Prc
VTLKTLNQVASVASDTLTPGAKAGLGFTYRMSSRTGDWVVNRVKEVGFAATSGLIKEGDALVSVDGR